MTDMPSDDARRYIPEIVARLRSLDPFKVILFGSQAQGTATEGSDLDLLVVLKSDVMPRTYRERENLYLQVARVLRDIKKKVAVDLIVHTWPMHAKFLETDSLFAQEVLQNGVVLYESEHARVARQGDR